MPAQYDLFITCSRGVEDLLSQECEQQGINTTVATGGVAFQGGIEQAYRMCLWSRVGSRVLLRLTQGEVGDSDDLYELASAVCWLDHLDITSSFAIDCNTSHQEINNSHYASLRIKDAIVDQLRAHSGARPSVDKDDPDVRINAHIDRDSCRIYIDLSGDPLHKRGSGRSAGVAPLRETLAAAMLYRCKWPQLAEQGAAFVDVMCGSGTLLLEAASMAAGHAPAQRRQQFGFMGWKQHDAAAWDELKAEASAKQGPPGELPPILGFDRSGRALQSAADNIQAAALDDVIELRQADSLVQELELPPAAGLVLTNPPYGKRIGDFEQLRQTYRELGVCLKQQFAGWQAAILTSEEELARCIGLRAHRRNTLYNGPLHCTLYQYRINETRSEASQRQMQGELHDNARMLQNRLHKNLKHLRKWARKNAVSCYRVYDADLPQYAVAIDDYDGQIIVQEYQAPGSIPAGRAMQHLEDVISVCREVFSIEREHIVLKTRKRQSGKDQYGGRDSRGEVRSVEESGLKFEIRPRDYLDTGLFLDHRLTRQLVRGLSAGRRVLNLFAYTGSFSVYAAAGGADTVTTVDMSNTYIDWARRNFELNDLDPRRYSFVRADCLVWMQQASNRYDLIVLDPPTFSNSSKMEDTLDINRDHVDLITAAMGLLDEDGVLLFSCNAGRFRIDEAALAEYVLQDITRLTTSEDFRRKPQHQCWLITREGVEVELFESSMKNE